MAVSNLDWTEHLTTLDFLRDIGKHFPVNQMLSRDVVRNRLESGGISFTEFSYQILQANDFLELHRRHDCALQVGGSDQWGNLVSGVDLIRRVTGDSVHALATPLITKPDGTKYGKTEGGAVWISPDLMSPYAFYQFWFNRSDAEVPGLLKVFTFRTRERSRPWKPRSPNGPQPGPASVSWPRTSPSWSTAGPSWSACWPRAGPCSGRGTWPSWTRARWPRRSRRCRTPRCGPRAAACLGWLT